ncbi:MBL fold metallo-hydrolase [Methanospirillum hungatei]|jgi:glyoxylase-like metal-dependent hydrolase (beta-lactamase superfamily II)|uniref:MBL fold metallo-hydrolase n=1 Tax=Methanospirillum hungatei TaxID=2203 RepID=UPI0026EA14F4|nr:MBL fold metallo-hydrolase [Methanospirillum hungatei]MCA1917262.1 MBL fold metallo-hydrolase [Methanospirillum hungatei]
MTVLSTIRVSERTWMLTFDDAISVMIIIGTRYTVLCDTHLGPDSIQEIYGFLASIDHPDNLFIFNSHSDWDHIWGNCACPDSIIAAHISCLERMKERSALDLVRNGEKTRGPVQIILPNLTFDSRLCLEDDDIEFIHAPGHTIDSSVCLDRKGEILYVGDLVEDPIPYIDYDRIDVYMKTLESLVSSSVQVFISAHSGIITRDLIRSNISYLNAVLTGKEIDTSLFGDYITVHQANINTRTIFRYEALAREILRDTFVFEKFWSGIPDPEGSDQESLIKFLNEYLQEIRIRRGIP